MNTVRLNAYAKLNLTLDITGREGGYHLLDSLVTTIDLFDRVTVKKRKDGQIRLTMRGMGSETIPPEENNAYLAAERFTARFHTSGAEIGICKNIPIGAGLGGSSADAAGVLRALAKLYETEDEAGLKSIADSIGSDVGYLLTGGFARMRGFGENLEFFPSLRRTHFLLLIPRTPVYTAMCYKKFDTLGEKGSQRTQSALELLLDGKLSAAARLFGNDLTAAAETLNGEVESAKAAAEAFSPLGVSMTGSGSAVFAVFETRELCEWARSRYRGECTALCADSVE